MENTAAAAPRRALPGGIWALGFVSLLMDTSSELVHSLLPVLMTSVLGASMAAIGVIEGVAEATAAVGKVFSGALSDFVRRRKLLVLLGYGLSACTKPVFPLAPSLGWVFGARFVDRLGKGIRGAPRDALLAASVAPSERGFAFGFNRAADHFGAILGPMLGGALLARHWTVEWMFVVGALPSLLCALWVVALYRTRSGRDANAPSERT